jgi:hypothetical protein
LNWGQFLRREWGAATFVLTVIIGLVAVPLALYIGNKPPTPIQVPIVTSPSPATGATTATPALTASPSPSKSP